MDNTKGGRALIACRLGLAVEAKVATAHVPLFVVLQSAAVFGRYFIIIDNPYLYKKTVLRIKTSHQLSAFVLIWARCTFFPSTLPCQTRTCVPISFIPFSFNSSIHHTIRVNVVNSP